MRRDSVHLRIDGQPRRSLVFTPDRPSAPLPIVCVLHGTGGTGLWAVRETRWDEWVDRAPLLLLAPDATRPSPDLPIRFYTNPPVWNDGMQRPPADRVTADDVAFFRALLDEAARRYPVDTSRIYVTGFSNGASMTFRLGAELATRIAAIAPVAGLCPPALPRPETPVPTLYLIGDSDPLVPLHGGTIDTPWVRGAVRPPVRQSLAQWIELLDASREPRPVETGIEGVSADHFDPWVEMRTIAGLGHHWPGGRGELNPRLAGPASDRLDATLEIWQFFQQHTRPHRTGSEPA